MTPGRTGTEVLRLLVQAITDAGYQTGKDGVSIAMGTWPPRSSATRTAATGSPAMC
jgi:hypothetical protein